MKRKIFLIAITIGIAVLGLLWVNSNLLAQDNNDANSPADE